MVEVNHEKSQLSAGKILYGSFLIGLASLIWLIIRTGTKPTRAGYPCQRMAAANAAAWLGAAVVPGLLARTQNIRSFFNRKQVKTALFVAAASLILLIAFRGVEASSSSKVIIDDPGTSGMSAGIVLSLSENRGTAGKFSDIFAVQGTTGADDGFSRLIDLMEMKGASFYQYSGNEEEGNHTGLIGRSDVVLIKINSQWDERGGTNTDLVKSIIDGIAAHPDGFIGEIIVADNGQGQYGSKGNGGSLAWEKNNALDQARSIERVVEEFSGKAKVSAILWDKITTTKVGEYSEGDFTDGYVLYSSPSARTGITVSYPKFKTPYNTYVSFKHGIWNPDTENYDNERLKVINVPVLKTHMIYGVTASIKHYMGVVSDKLTSHNAHRSVGRGGMGTQMAETRLPVLNIIDAVWVNAVPGQGPRTPYSKSTEVNIIAAGKDPIALDYWAAGKILIPTAVELGYSNTGSMDPDVTVRGSFGEWLRLSHEELRIAGYQTTIDIDNVDIYVSTLENFSFR
jgi:hypothetical protein